MSDPEAPGPYASPACALHEVDPAYADPKMGTEELVPALNELLEAERAGAKTLAASLHTWPEPPVSAVLAPIRDDEARYVALLTHWVTKLGGTPSKATGAFFEKATSIPDQAARLAFLNRGQAWVARRLDILLPRIADDELHAALMEMRDRHRDNIARAEAFGASSAG